MKKVIFSTLAMVFVLVSCNQKNKEVETINTTTIDRDTVVVTDSATIVKPEVHDKLYACPMHPEVKGKKGDECPKCGMELTEPVVE